EYMTLYERDERNREEGIEIGREEGMEIGLEQGIKTTREQTALKLLAKSMEIEDVAEITGLSLVEISELK
ncbi:MAG: hypothetical protein RR131_02570, partial [Anaerovorax sp.]